ncbi:MAG TPA: PAS domain S-box protein [bacterium]|nr:PAS domain S-box protein [bacterium]
MRLLIRKSGRYRVNMDLEKVIYLLNQFRKQGMSILFLTQRIDDIYNFADSVTIIKNGEVLLTDSVKDIDGINLIKMTYASIAKNTNVKNINQEFYQLLKYNEAILQNLPVNLIVTDNEQRIRMINELGKGYFGLKGEQYYDLPIQDLFFKDQRNEQTSRIIKEALAEHEERSLLNVPIYFNSRGTINNIKIYPIFDGVFLIGSIIIIEDITEQEKLREQFILSEKLASVGLLAAGVAHEINNPLEIIYNYLKYLKFNTSDNDLRETVDDLHEEIASISNIVSNLITFSDSKKSGNEDIELNELIEKMVKLVKFNAQKKNIKINFSSAKETIRMRANKNEIKQVILNLMKNSFDASQKEYILDFCPLPKRLHRVLCISTLVP